MDTVVFDLFGTLVDAPTRCERLRAAARLAAALGCDTATVDGYLRDSWRPRHDGTVRTLDALAAHLGSATNSCDTATAAVVKELREIGLARLRPAPTVVDALTKLRARGFRLGVLSDAGPEIAAVWPHSPVAALVDTAVFSCHVGAVKPDQRLYVQVQHAVGVPANRILYVGDGGGDELNGAITAGMTALGVRRRGQPGALAFDEVAWDGPTVESVEQLPDVLGSLSGGVGGP